MAGENHRAVGSPQGRQAADSNSDSNACRYFPACFAVLDEVRGENISFRFFRPIWLQRTRGGPWMTSRPAMIAAISILATLLVGCAGATAGSYDRVTGQGDSWSVGAADPRFESLSPCSEDPSVGTSLQSADMPSSHLAMQLVSGSTELDAVRVADCLATALTSGKIWISSPRE